ncbi:MAG: sensor histidine kinase [Lachnospiraceae bacterium]|nr:sensor histidine kinase [Lachnospiraceae bacterium]
MREILERNIILVACSMLLLLFVQGDYVVVACLIGIIETELLVGCGYIFRTQMPENIVAVICVIAAVIWWPLMFFLPVLSYSIIHRGKWWQESFLLVPLLTGFFRNLSCYREMWPIGMLLVLIVAAGFIAYENQKALEYQRLYLKQVDSSTSLAYTLKQQNAKILAGQDDSVRLATLQERNRIAREIHDNVGHMLSRTILQTGAMLTIYKEEPLHGQLQSVNDSMNEAMNSIRESVHDLHNDSFDMKGSVEELMEELRKHYQVHYEYDLGTEVPSNIKYCFLAIVKEATANIMKHCNGTTVSVVLREHPGFYQMLVSDNGTKKMKRTNDGIGLNNMEDRVKSMGGTISFSDEEGFKVLVSIPKNQKE